MSYAHTLSEVRRISSGGMPRKIRTQAAIRRDAGKLKWRANALVLRLLEKLEARP